MIDDPPPLDYARGLPARQSRLPRLALALAWLYPALVIGSLYLTWLAAWLTLGRQPRSSLDDPKEIGRLVDVFCFLTLLLLFSFPVAGIAGLGIGFVLTPWWVHQHRDKAPFGLPLSTALLLALFVAYYVGAFMFVCEDPFLVLYWFMD